MVVLQKCGGQCRALQYILRDTSDFILILVGSHSRVGAAQLLWFLSAEISLCGGSLGSGQGKGEPPGGARQHLSQAEPRSEPRVTCLVSAAPWSPSWSWGSPARLSVCSCLDGTFHTICQVKLCFISGHTVGSPGHASLVWPSKCRDRKLFRELRL